MFDTKQMEQRRVDIIKLDWVLHGVVADIIRRTECEARLHARARQPQRGASGVMIAAIVVGGKLALRIDGAPEFAALDDQSVFQQTALL